MNANTQPKKGISTPTEAALIERQQLAFNALSTASWHLARGDIDRALGRILRAATHLKTVTNNGRV